MASHLKGVLPLGATLLLGCATQYDGAHPSMASPEVPPVVENGGQPGKASSSASKSNDTLATEVAALRAALVYQRDLTDALRRHIELMEKAIKSGLVSDLPSVSAIAPAQNPSHTKSPIALDVPTLSKSSPPPPGDPLGFEDLGTPSPPTPPPPVVAPGVAEDPQSLWDEAGRAKILGDAGKAMVLLRTLERNTPQWDKGDAVQQMLGECALELKQFPLAVAIARGFYPKYPNSPLVPQLKLIEAQGLEAQGNGPAAVRLNIEVIQMAPRTPAAEQAHQALQRLREAL